ncbi:unnamed protein product [Symbiodinium microadriaticum]|nr:unnamed protein product [Symbiodinium microadriaticum]
MGGRGKAKWGNWPKEARRAHDGWDWRSSGSAWNPKGAGKWEQPQASRRYQGDQDDRSSQFPGFETMRPRTRAPPTTRELDVIEGDGDDLPVGSYMKGVQRILNSFRKAENKTRKIEGLKEELDAKWEAFQQSLKDSYMKERKKYQEKVARFTTDMEEVQQAKEDAIQELKDALKSPSSLIKNKAPVEDTDALEDLAKLLATPAPGQADNLSDLLAAALTSGDVKEAGGRTKLLEAIEKHKQQRAPTTPPRRRASYVDRTPVVEKPRRDRVELEDPNGREEVDTSMEEAMLEEVGDTDDEGDHDRWGPTSPRRWYDIFDVLEEMFSYLDGMPKKYATMQLVAQGSISTLLWMQFCALFAGLGMAANRGNKGVTRVASKLCLAFAVLRVVHAGPPPTTPPRRDTVPQQTDLELWTSGQLTMREQLARALTQHTMNSPLERSSGTARPPNLQVPLGTPQPEELPLRVVGANVVHVTLWTATPYYEAEVVDVELNFPLSIHMIKRALRESFDIIPNWANELIPTVPQLGEKHGSFVAVLWHAQGPVFAFYHEGQVTRQGVLKHIEDFDLTEVEVFPFGSLLPIESGSPIAAVPGGVLKVVPRGMVCEWEDDLTDRLEDDETWDAECDLPAPIEGLYTVLQSTTEQIVFEDDPAAPLPIMDMAREVFDEVHMVRKPAEEHAHLAHAGRHIYQTVAVIDQVWPNNGEAAYIYLDLRGIGCFTQSGRLDPDDRRRPSPGALGDNLLRVRDGEIIEMRFEPSSSMSTSEEEPTDEESDSSSSTGDRGDSTDHTMDSGSGPEQQGGEPRGPPPPRPLDRSRSPRRSEDMPEEMDTCVKVAAVPTHDLTQVTMALPHDWWDLRAIFRPWNPEWLQPPLKDLKIPTAIQDVMDTTSHWSELLFGEATEEKREVHIYTDGSADEKKGTSGYGVVLILKCGTILSLLGILGGQLGGSDEGLWDLQGPMALRAEQAALAAALLWIIQFRCIYPGMACTIRYDCMAAGQGMTGAWAPVDPFEQKVHELALLTYEASWATTHVEHIQAHSGHVWNELADLVAKKAATGYTGFATPPSDAVRCFHASEFGWMATELLGRRTGALPIAEGHLRWHERPDEPSPLKPEELIPTVGGAEGDIQHAENFEMKVATVNIQGLAGNYRYIEEQCDQKGLNMIFLQETKAPAGQCTSQLYTRLASESNRHWGVAIWLHRKLGALMINQRPQVVQEADVSIRHESDRLLAVMVNVAGKKMALVAAHCPHASLPRERQQFLAKLRNVLVELKNATLLVCGIDLNGRVPTAYPGVTGDIEYGEAEDAGWSFVDSLNNIGGWIPSTYQGIHQGDSETYRHPSGTSHRIDYVAFGGRALTQVTGTEIDQDFDNGSPNVDHHLLVAQCRGEFQGSGSGSRLWRPKYDRDKLSTAQGRKVLEAALSCFEHPAWNVSVDEHCQHIQNYLVRVLSEHFPAPQRAERASYIPNEVWELRAVKNSFKRRVRTRKDLWKDALARAFRQWATQENYDVSYLVAREGLLYNIASAAIRIATARIRTQLKMAKNEGLQKIAAEGHQGVIQVLQRVKRAGYGGTKMKPVRKALPILIHPETGNPAASRQDRDEIWLQHFGAQEYGDVIDVDEFLCSRGGYYVDVPLQWSVDDLPNVVQIEEALRRTPKGKACGLDGVPSDLLPAAPTQLALILQPLFIKSMVTGAQPTQWRGGILFEAYKNSGAPTMVDNYRSLYISSFLGKAYHKTVRAMIGDEIEQLLHPLHCGTRRASPVSFPAIFVVAMQRKCKAEGRSCATLYVDTKSAYYRVVRDLATGCIENDAQVIRLFKAFGLPPDDLHDLMQMIQEGGGRLCHSRAGSRPGESFADVIFAFIYSKILYRIHEHLEAEELNISLDWEEEAGAFPSGDGGTPQQGWEATWADDSAYVVEDESPRRLLQKAQRVGDLVLENLEAHGMQPNVKAGKTSIMIQLRGPGSNKARKMYFQKGCKALKLPSTGVDLPVVNQYRHLGSILDHQQTFRPEARHRLALASQAYESARPLLLGNKTLTLSTRMALFEITVATTFFNLALWQTEGPAWDSLCTGHARLARRLLANQLKDKRLFRLPLPVVLWKTGCLPLELLAVRQRLSLLGSLVRAAPGLLWAALQAEKMWLAQIRVDLAWVIAGREEQWPPLNQQSWPDWWRLLKEAPQRLKRLTKARLHEEQQTRMASAAVDICLWAMAKELRQGTMTQTREHIWWCRRCMRAFDDKAKLSVHYFKVHQRVAKYRLYAQGTRCQACGTECWSDGRLAVHLRSSTRCVDILGTMGSKVPKVVPGFGSKQRRKADVEQYTMAVPERTEVDRGRPREETWHPSATEAYKDVCDYVQDDAVEDDEHGVLTGLKKILTKYPLYRQEEDDILNRVVTEIAELQSDMDTAIWAPAQANDILAQLRECRDWVWLPFEDNSHQRCQTLNEFSREVEMTDWATILAASNSDGTRSNARRTVPMSWEADWQKALHSMDLSAVADDQTSLLPSCLRQAWLYIKEGKQVELEAPQSFWDSRLALPFKAAGAFSAT